MPNAENAEATRIVNAIAAGDRSGVDRLFSLLYGTLRDLAARYLKGERPDQTFSPTDLVHEAYMKLIDQRKVEWRGKTHFLAIGAQAMRRILVDHARYKHRAKRGGGRVRVQLNEQIALSPEREEDLLALDEALTRLTQVDPRQATIVELRFFGGLNVSEVAEVLGVSKRTVESEWTAVRAWLRRELAEESGSG